jgi:cell division protein FtsA
MAKSDRYVVGIDIGSSKVGVLIGQRDDGDGLEVVGKGIAPNRGTRRGNIVNVDQTVEALKEAAEEAEIMAGVEIERAYVGVAGVDIRSVNSRGMVSVARKDREITAHDVKRVLDAARSAALPADREILHAIPQEFVVDDQDGISEPLGMLGSRLEVAVHLVTAHQTRGQTLLTCVNKAGIRVVEIVFEPLAAAQVVLTQDERELGSLLIDLGAGTAGYSLFADGEVQHSGVAPAPITSPTTWLSSCARPSRRPRRSSSRAGAAWRAWSATKKGSPCRRSAAAARTWCGGASSPRSSNRAPRSSSSWCARTSSAWDARNPRAAAWC